MLSVCDKFNEKSEVGSQMQIIETRTPEAIESVQLTKQNLSGRYE
jgi:hypothetical protein